MDLQKLDADFQAQKLENERLLALEQAKALLVQRIDQARTNIVEASSAVEVTLGESPTVNAYLEAFTTECALLEKARCELLEWYEKKAGPTRLADAQEATRKMLIDFQDSSKGPTMQFRGQTFVISLLPAALHSTSTQEKPKLSSTDAKLDASTLVDSRPPKRARHGDTIVVAPLPQRQHALSDEEFLHQRRLRLRSRASLSLEEVQSRQGFVFEYPGGSGLMCAVKCFTCDYMSKVDPESPMTLVGWKAHFHHHSHLSKTGDTVTELTFDEIKERYSHIVQDATQDMASAINEQIVRRVPLSREEYQAIRSRRSQSASSPEISQRLMLPPRSQRPTTSGSQRAMLPGKPQRWAE
ncbi:uncharacterized protein JN550_005815 [Neoarthrinium moseri]|uniref:uncharacterized protein n=1 Tax=Neoarthrinium moseri TaxID=1658444 RepID=UPI001FDC1DF7|nr:uncharacterized protein JN550_005815 [Neoarthrinium moseri]KAI1869185.1 hypothetical protein JN550_005815 [Neoarthrinium moseri]